ncbi:MAG TPA: HAMP domain-containing sensor histidine kinase [Phycisphaerae bacterium]|nr:HAMP domain-containing sensor histidine kinase [Phycisphaerae bacterium]
MKRTRTLWLAFAVCLAVLLAAMAAVSSLALRLDRAERHANRRAAAEEKIRLALWRMDSALLPLVVQESARPYFVYQPFHPLGMAYTWRYRQLATNEVLLPSPLLTSASEDVLVHFQLDEAGRLTSPQAPTGNQLDLATDGYLTGEQADEAAARLAEVGRLLDRRRLLSLLPAPLPAAASRPIALGRPDANEELPVQQRLAAENIDRLMAKRRGQAFTRDEITSLMNSSSTVARYAANDQAQFVQDVAFNPTVAPAAVETGKMHPVWLGGALVLARRVRVDGAEWVQGCRLNWPHLSDSLLRQVVDVLPAASLSAAGIDDADGYVLATLPVRLVPGEVPLDVAAVRSTVAFSLLIAWACVLIGAAAVAVVLGKTLGLSERRGAFVSAVTHELRTPLTTFRLYADMLAEGMVADEHKRAAYLRRLRDEADRLSHLVENVLAYARLAGPRSAGHLESVRVGELLDRSRERLEALTGRADMELVVAADDAAAGAAVRCSASAVEQVLLNLVDNACKYAGRAEDRRIHLTAALSDGAAVLAVRDHGPGISPAGRGRLFHAFRKSAHEAAGTAPGIGLGLSLSRRLARNMGGDLRSDPPADAPGARFCLTLPLGGPS